MAVTCGFFNSVDGDRLYNADQMSTYFEGLISDGVYENVGDRLQVTADTGMTVNVGTGRAIVKTHWVKNDAALALTVGASDVQKNRIDAVVVRYNATNREITIDINPGTPTEGTAEPPERSTGADVYELVLAYISVPKTVTTITQSMITDMRPSGLCGWITGLVDQVDTSDLYAQWAAAYAAYYAQSTAAFDAYFAAKRSEFEAWFEHLTQQLNVDTTLHRYQNTVSAATTTSEITIGIPKYDSNADILFAYINGVYLVEGTDYIISGTGDSAKIILNRPITGQNSITFVVIKSVIGEGSGTYTVGAVTLGTNAAPDGIWGNATREDI